MEFNIEKIDLKSSEKFEVENFLENFNLLLDSDVEYTICARMNGKIVGTCSFSGKVLKCFAVREDLQNEGIASKLITYITNVMFDNGIYETFIFTKQKNRAIFEALGYKEVEEADGVVLLEGGTADIKSYIKHMYENSRLEDGNKAALVMNCNPFTIGHRYLIEKASKENEEVVVFIVQEDKSDFSFKTRLELVRQGTKDLKNVHIIPGGNYIISLSTFPSYFIKKEDERLKIYTSLDAKIFAKYIAPTFKINKRYIGTEPYCNVTLSYNEALLSILPANDIEVKLIERKTIDGEIVSASKVRELLKQGKLDEVRKFVPDVTFKDLQKQFLSCSHNEKAGF